MRYLITGGLGFIGTNFINKIIKNKKNIILNIDYNSKFSMSKNIKKTNNYEYINCNISNKKKIEQVINKFKPNIIVNFAAESHVDRSINNPNKFISSNILGSFNLLENSKKYYNEIKNRNFFFRFIHISTDEVYGSLKLKEKSFTENNKYNPNSPYAASKASSDFLVRSWYQTYKLPIIITNCSNNYGPWQHPEKLIPKTIINALEGKKIPIYGKGNNIRDWIFVDDHVDAIISIIKKGKIGQKYNIGANQEYSNLNIVKIICAHLDKIRPSEKNHYDLVEHVVDRKGHDFRYAINSNKIKREFNFKTKYNFKTGIKKTINWYVDNYDYIKSIIK